MCDARRPVENFESLNVLKLIGTISPRKFIVCNSSFDLAGGRSHLVETCQIHPGNTAAHRIRLC